MEKTMTNTNTSGTQEKVSDIKVFGNPDIFQLICKASSQSEGWMKSTKAMEVQGCGCLVQVTTQQKNPDGSYSVAESLVFVPASTIGKNEDGTLQLIAM